MHLNFESMDLCNDANINAMDNAIRNAKTIGDGKELADIYKIIISNIECKFEIQRGEIRLYYDGPHRYGNYATHLLHKPKSIFRETILDVSECLGSNKIICPSLFFVITKDKVTIRIEKDYRRTLILHEFEFKPKVIE